MPCKVLIVDYRTGNFSALARAIDRAGGEAFVSSKTNDVERCDKLVLAGVGHFDRAIGALRELRLEDPINEAVLLKKKAVLGVCLGMELMAKTSEEGAGSGLGWLDADAVRLSVEDPIKYKVPHIGWNTVNKVNGNDLFRGIGNDPEFYFNHSFHLKVRDQRDVSGETEYGSLFVSSVAKENIFGVQFHPEKSHETGIRLLKNFVEL